MSDTSGSPLTELSGGPGRSQQENADRGAIVDGAPKSPFRCPSPRATSRRRQRPPCARQQQTSRVVADARMPRTVPAVNRTLASELTVWPSTCPSFRRAGPRGSHPVDRCSRGPGGPYTTSCRGWAWSCGRVLSQHERDPVLTQRIAIGRPGSSTLAAMGPRLDVHRPHTFSSRSIDPLEPHPARLDSRLRQGGSVPVLQIPGRSVGLSRDLWSYDTEYPPSDPCGHS